MVVDEETANGDEMNLWEIKSKKKEEEMTAVFNRLIYGILQPETLKERLTSLRIYRNHINELFTCSISLNIASIYVIRCFGL